MHRWSGENILTLLYYNFWRPFPALHKNKAVAVVWLYEPRPRRINDDWWAQLVSAWTAGVLTWSGNAVVKCCAWVLCFRRCQA